MPSRKTKDPAGPGRRPGRATRRPAAFDPNNPLFGRVEDERFLAREVDRVLGYLPHPIFGAAAYPIRDSGAGKVVLLYKFLEAQCGGRFPVHTQTIGDCEGHGWGLSIDLVKAAQIAAGAAEEFTGETATEVLYAGSRVEIGHGQCGTLDGSVGAWVAQFAHDYGTLVRAKYPSIDLTTYSGDLAQRLGMPRVGVPDDLEPTVREHPVRTTSLISTYEEARDAIANGYAIAVSSTVGFQAKRDRDGFARAEGKWPHCMCFGGVDDSSGRPGLLCINSWGPSWISGPTRLDQPAGSFWVDADVVNAMLRMNDSFAPSGYVGYPRQVDKLEYMLI